MLTFFIDYCIISLLFQLKLSEREKMVKKEDARVRRTKYKLITTFHALLNEKSFENITVNEICDRADIRRATFYKHFTDKYDFVKYFVTVLRERFDHRMWRKSKLGATSDYYVRYVYGIVRFLTDNEVLVKKLLESEAFSTIVNIVTAQNYVDTKERLEESIKEGMTLPASTTIVASFMTGGVAHAIITWFLSGKPVPEEEFINNIASIIRAIQVKE